MWVSSMQMVGLWCWVESGSVVQRQLQLQLQLTVGATGKLVNAAILYQAKQNGIKSKIIDQS